ncbi:hypothetical protein SDRG_02912 [Saprolegnia diclina VS20]|uniref:Secreted protein n=1 Tax=Saprolegnia diclina (strain VS20) TaxID=1156394 RepID=T0S390_SAPDV|nr:hypothetical protein SDRG_02912 [Saprolegnia diclina VS20]EQC39468.1 hypothetical protein SDRG_02912 [Saprolegnia diclina VS20]|eukprot:XP_008606740.1 hypothetical protein SDRG_02912 [Saprolegnia diclina VS20]
MQLFQSLLLLVVASVAALSPAYNATPALLPACTEPAPQSCAFYNACLEVAHPCGAQGYALGFGEFYCNKFAAYKDKFTANGQQWMYNTMTCLQKKLGVALKDPTMTCDAIKTFAFDSHPECYTNNGGPSVCELSPLKDWTTVLRVVGLKTLFKLDTIKNGASTGLVCMHQLLSWAKKLPSTTDDPMEPNLDWNL